MLRPRVPCWPALYLAFPNMRVHAQFNQKFRLQDCRQHIERSYLPPHLIAPGVSWAAVASRISALPIQTMPKWFGRRSVS